MKPFLFTALALLASLTARADCGPQTLDWPSADGQNMCGTQSGSGHEGDVIGVGSMTLRESGNATFICSGGNWQLQGGSCTASDPLGDEGPAKESKD